jgi:hypothetical protein
MTFRERRRVVVSGPYDGGWGRRLLLATPPADCLRGLLVGRSLVEFALRYCQVLIELAKPRQIAGGQLHPRRGMTAGPEETHAPRRPALEPLPPWK